MYVSLDVLTCLSVRGASNLDKLHQILTEHLMIRRLKKDVRKTKMISSNRNIVFISSKFLTSVLKWETTQVCY